jgi:hypothetical protein
MDFEAFVLSLGFDIGTLSEAQKLGLQAAWRKSHDPAPVPVPAPAASGFAETVQAIEAENARVETIQTRGLAAMREFAGDTEKTRQIREMTEAAAADGKTTAKDFELALMRAGRWAGPNTFSPGRGPVNQAVLEAAICQTHKLAHIEKMFNAETLEAAHKQYRQGMTLQELFYMAAQRNNNFRGSIRDYRGVCEAAFPRGYAANGMGPSQISVPGILSNVGNKFIESHFNYGEQSWREVAKVKSAKDFKSMSTYRLTGANKFKKLPPGGELKHGTLSELSYTNQVDTWGIMLGIDRRDYINDDLGAFTGANEELGRGGIDSLNEEFWTEWLNDSTFFPTDVSKNNYQAGSPGSVLSLLGLANADTLFGIQTKPDGTPLGAMPKILLVPRALWAIASNLMKGNTTAGAQTTPTETTENIWAGMFKVVPSVYLQSSLISGSSSTAWYLLADPNNIAAIEVAFLNGQDTPTMETSEFDFARLGISMRAYMDFGIAKQEYRGAVKFKGAA